MVDGTMRHIKLDQRDAEDRARLLVNGMSRSIYMAWQNKEEGILPSSFN